MRKVIKKWGHSLAILLTVDEAKAYNLKKGEIIEIEIKKIEGEQIGNN